MIRSRDEVLSRVRSGRGLAGETIEGIESISTGSQHPGSIFTGATLQSCSARGARFGRALFRGARSRARGFRVD